MFTVVIFVLVVAFVWSCCGGGSFSCAWNVGDDGGGKVGACDINGNSGNVGCFRDEHGVNGVVILSTAGVTELVVIMVMRL